MQWDVQLPLLVAAVATGATLLWARRQAEADLHASSTPRLAAFVPWARALFPVLLLVLCVRAFVVEPYRVPTASMAPTIAAGDYVLVSKFAYGLRLPLVHWRFVPLGEPRRGEVMVFAPPHEARYFVKRVVGLPGDRVRYLAGELYVNGIRVEVRVDGRDDARDGVQQFVEQLDGTRHLLQRYIGMRSTDGEWLVPTGHYFTLGDNRDMSEDSRFWGYVAREQVVGRAIAIWAHKAPGWTLPSFDRSGVIH